METLIIIFGSLLQFVLGLPFWAIGYIAAFASNYCILGWNTFYGLDSDDFGDDDEG